MILLALAVTWVATTTDTSTRALPQHWGEPIAGVDTLALSTEEDLVRAIVRLAAIRQKRRRLTAGHTG